MTEIELMPCPFCGGPADIAKHFKEAMWRLTHRCEVIGPIMIDWRESHAALAAIWNCRAALSIPPAAERGEWQGIESAPKKGIILFFEPPENVDTCVWSNAFGSWVDGEGCDVEPTHWQPLPAPPSPRTPEGQ